MRRSGKVSSWILDGKRKSFEPRMDGLEKGLREALKRRSVSVDACEKRFSRKKAQRTQKVKRGIMDFEWKEEEIRTANGRADAKMETGRADPAQNCRRLVGSLDKTTEGL
jgi:adenylate cyclase